MSTIRIQDREAIPIRALPFVAGSEGFPRAALFPPSLIVQALHQAQDASTAGIPSLRAYALKDGKPTTVDSMALDVAAPISDFPPEIDEPIRDSFSRLPPGMFVFLDDLRAYMNWLLPPGALDGQCREEIEIVTNLNLPESVISTIYQGFNDARKDESTHRQCSSAEVSDIADADARPLMIAWKQLVLDSWPAMRKMHGGRDPTAQEVIRYLRTNDKTGVIVNQPGQQANVLHWAKVRGGQKPVKLKTIQTTICEFKKKGLIPS